MVGQLVNQETDKMPNESSQQDLVFCADHNLSFDNRWRFTGDLVDYGSVKVWTSSQLGRKYPNLKRIKINGLPWKPMADLLEKLCTCTQLEQLEIDTLELYCGSKNRYRLNFLKRFSVDAVRIVNKHGLEIGGKSSPVRLTSSRIGANQIEHLYFGSNSIEHFDCHILRGPIKTIGFARACEALHNSINPQIAEILCEELLRVGCRLSCQDDLITSLVSGQLGDFRVLRFNLDKLSSTAYRPCARRLEFLHDFYNHIRRTSDYSIYYRDRPIVKYGGEKKIFINGVRVDLERLQFSDYRFDLPLADVHRHNHLHNHLELDVCSSVTEVSWMTLPEAFELKFFDEPVDRSVESVSQDRRCFAGLMRLYPNLRVVILENLTKQPVEQRPFLAFLGACRALTELRLVYSGFPNAFYDHLGQMASLASLHQFTLIEPFGFSAVRTQFAFLTSEHLRRLRSNLAIRTVMQECVLERMQPLAEFEFQFWHPNAGHLAYHYRFRKLDADRWDMLVEKENFHEQTAKHPVVGGILTGESLLMAFGQPYHSVITSHWLDDPAISSSLCPLI